ncbi:hypothetical protein Ga0466249_001304 [Sporomusaceae bacterium BoRhaA]|nr:hypothetical protein [Pelorhabdus rhamnosifermentans]
MVLVHSGVLVIGEVSRTEKGAYSLRHLSCFFESVDTI